MPSGAGAGGKDNPSVSNFSCGNKFIIFLMYNSVKYKNKNNSEHRDQ